MSATESGRFNCESCGRAYGWKAELAGRNAKCKCGAIMTVPVEPSGAAAPAQVRQATAARPARAAAAAPAAVATAPAPPAACPSCGSPVSAGAVICLSCGFNVKEGKKLTTQTGGMVRASTGPRGKVRKVRTGEPAGFWERWTIGWELGKISYGILWDFKQLILFPIMSAGAAVVVVLSFVLPLWGTGTMEQFDRTMDGNGKGANPLLYVVVFAFYFVMYFIMTFFGTALTACAMKVTAGEAPTLRYGLGIAVKRMPQIVAWSALSALVGVLLKMVERHEKIGKIIAAILGSGWAVLTYFVVPVLCVEGVGPFTAVKRSVATLRDTWGGGVIVGNVALGIFTSVLALPIYLLVFIGLFAAFALRSIELGVATVVLGVVLIIIHSAADSAARGIFRALLYNYATGRSLPADIDEASFANAFGSRGIEA